MEDNKINELNEAKELVKNELEKASGGAVASLVNSVVVPIKLDEAPIFPVGQDRLTPWGSVPVNSVVASVAQGPNFGGEIPGEADLQRRAMIKIEMKHP